MDAGRDDERSKRCASTILYIPRVERERVK